MKHRLLSSAALSVPLVFGSAVFSGRTAADTAPATQPVQANEMVGRTFVLLMLADHPPKLDETAAAELQRKHLEHIGKMAASGNVLVAGPFSQRDDERLRGALVFRCPIEEARVMANEDPAVKAGRLKVVCMIWNTSQDAMVFPAEAR